MSSASAGAAAEEFRIIPFTLSWRTLLRLSAYAELVLLIITMITLRDVLAMGLSVIILLALALVLVRWDRSSSVLSMGVRGALQILFLRTPIAWFGVLVLAIIFADISAYTVTGAISNVMSGGDFIALVLPASLATFAVMGLISAIAVLIKRRKSDLPSGLALNIAVTLLLVWVIIVLSGLLMGPQENVNAASAVRPIALKLVTENMAYSTTTLDAPERTISVSMENHDLFWHTFTIDDLGVDLKVPMRGKQRIEFTAPPGTYRFHCTIPGHDLIGMNGTLTVH